MYGKYSAWVSIFAILLLSNIGIFLFSFSDDGYVLGFAYFVLLVFPIGLIVFAKIFFNYLRIKNTVYRLYANKLEVYSYTIKFLGIRNNVVNTTQLRQIQANSNSWLDVFFFGCGYVTLTVSGDVADFRIEDVYLPGKVKRKIEIVCFGEDAVSPVRDDRPTVS